MKMTLREVSSASIYARKAKAYEIDLKIKLAGDKKGFSDLNKVLAEDKIELHEEELRSINTDERTVEVKELFSSIEALRRG